MQTLCNLQSFEFHPLNQRQVVAQFDGGEITTDADGLLLRDVENRMGIIARFAACFWDRRAVGQVEHKLQELVGQQVYALALGYEGANNHDELRQDPLLAENPGPTGKSRARKRDRGKALAGKSTLNRLELTKAEAEKRERYKKIDLDMEAVNRLLVEIFLDVRTASAFQDRASADCLQEVERILTRIRQARPGVRITIRGESGFCLEELMVWCE